MITAENSEAWQALATELSKNYPSVGKVVKIVGGRKHKEKIGRVVKHQRDDYYSTQYKSEASLMHQDMCGRTGFVILVQQSDGSTFWCKANYAEILSDVPSFEVSHSKPVLKTKAI